MIKLYGFGEAFGVPDPSPYVLKVDSYLTMSSLDFERVQSVENLNKAPKGKLPYISLNNELVADSFFIFEQLRQQPEGNIDNWLSNYQRSQVKLMIRAIDEDLCYCLVYSRWILGDTWPYTREAFFGSLPWGIKSVVAGIVRGKTRKLLQAHGYGKHSKDEILTLFRSSLESLSEILGGKNFFMGERPCSLDATAFGCLAQFIVADLDNEFNRIAREQSNLVVFCQRVMNNYY